MYNTNKQFTTIDRDNDKDGTLNCAQKFSGGGYWYQKCTPVSPNAEYCPSSSCGSNEQNLKVGCLMGTAYSMKKFQIDVFIE